MLAVLIYPLNDSVVRRNTTAVIDAHAQHVGLRATRIEVRLEGADVLRSQRGHLVGRFADDRVPTTMGYCL